MALFVVGRPDAPAEGGGLLSSIYEWLPAYATAPSSSPPHAHTLCTSLRRQTPNTKNSDLLNIPLPGSFCFRLQKSRVAELLLGLAAGCVIGQMLLSYDDRTCIVAEGEVEADEMKPGGYVCQQTQPSLILLQYAINTGEGWAVAARSGFCGSAHRQRRRTSEAAHPAALRRRAASASTIRTTTFPAHLPEAGSAARRRSESQWTGCTSVPPAPSRPHTKESCDTPLTFPFHPRFQDPLRL